MQRLRQPFYGWWIVGAAIVLQALPAGLLMQAFGTYIVLLQRDFGWSRTVLSGAFAAIRLEEGLLGPIQGWLLDRFGPRSVMRVGVIIMAIGFFILARIETVFWFYGAFLVMAVGASLMGFLSITTVIVHWFERQRSMAMGMALLGTAIGGLALPAVTWGLETWGWRAVANLSGLLILALGVPAVQLIRRRPQDMGLLPDGRVLDEDGADPATRREGEPERAPTPAFTAKQALRTRSFWFISLAHTASVLVVSVIQVHFVVYVTEDLGVSLSLAAWMLTLQTITNLISRPVGGWIADRTSTRWVTIVAMLMHAVALLMLAFFTSTLVIALTALLNGLAWGTRVPVIVAMRAEYFGAGSFGAIMGVSSMVVTAGAIIAPLAAAWAYDVLGSYTLSFTALAILAGLGSLFLLFLPPPRAYVAPEGATQPVASH